MQVYSSWRSQILGNSSSREVMLSIHVAGEKVKTQQRERSDVFLLVNVFDAPVVTVVELSDSDCYRRTVVFVEVV